MLKLSSPNLPFRQSRMLLIYNLYRFLCIAIFASLYSIAPAPQTSGAVYFFLLSLYFVFGMVNFVLWFTKNLAFKYHVLLSGVIDVVVVVALLAETGLIFTALGTILYVYIAMLSILLPGRTAIFFAAVATCMLLAISIIEYVTDAYPDISLFFSSGIYSIGFFATAVTAWYLALWVKANEALVQSKRKELKSVHRLNEYIVEQLQYGVIYVDSKQRIKIINQAAYQFLGIKPLEHLPELKSLPPKLYKKYLKFISKTLESTPSKQGTTKIGNLQVEFYASSESSDEASVLITINDMTEVSQQAQQMKLASLGFFSASIAHELRNPLGVISHACQLLKEYEDLDQEEQHLKDLILKNCTRMNQIIKNVLQITRNQEATPENINLNQFLTEFRKDFLKTHACKIALQLPRDHSGVCFDRSQLDQVLVILCDNAIAHGCDPNQGIAQISIQVSTVRNQTKISLTDTGPGIKKKAIKHIFDPFFSTKVNGSGMGLFIAKDLCEINKARLVNEESDQGAHFVIYVSKEMKVSV